MKLFFGKISQSFSEQHELNFYAAGEKGSPWYNGLDIGDFVFPVFKGRISKLWKVIGYGDTPVKGKKYEDKCIQFEAVKNFSTPYQLATQFCNYKYFETNLELLNKIAKSTSSEQKGFYELVLLPNCPNPENIDLNETKKIILAFEDTEYTYSEYDIRVTLSNADEFKIDNIEIFSDGSFSQYKTLWDLYLKKNDTRYTLQQLYKYALEDEAPKKEKYLKNVISDIVEKGYFIVSMPIALYDNIIVGRKKTTSRKNRKVSKTQLAINEEIDESIDEQKFEELMPYVDLLNFNPNIILYGPPGTGKTYTAQRIIEANEFILTGDPGVSFNQVKMEGRVEFVTFHQSYSYEEFVEGIRPKISNEEESGEIEGIKYEITPGILRNIANNASLELLKKNTDSSVLASLRKESRVYKVSLGERYAETWVYDRCKKENTIAIGWLDKQNLIGKDYNYIFNELRINKPEGSPEPTNDASSINIFVNDLKEGDIVFIYDGPFTIRDIGIVDSDYKHEINKNEYTHTRKVKWIKEFGDSPLDISSYNSNVKLTMKTIYPLNRITFDDLAAIIGEEEDSIDKPKDIKPFYLIIDEINRGNISKIFGELITLIEEDKRDSLKITLPYSKKPFALPSNLYFIGTMNTADRSIALLDTALRRRFTFRELEPDPEIILKVSTNPIIEGEIDLSKLLLSLNQRIQKAYDRDHRIGHSYFLNAISIKSLKQVWYYQIIPLLLEYFYNDGKKVSEIIGTSFIDPESCSVKNDLSTEKFIDAILNISNNE